jgi:phosphatidylserine/phosphatidylglycerophosphate/cardiolipin synthase-like enzyme
VPIWIDAQARIAHAKTMVIDSAVTLTGSMNWTRGAAVNSEDLNLISSPAVAAAYAGHWRDRLAVSAPLEGAKTGAGGKHRCRWFTGSGRRQSGDD